MAQGASTGWKHGDERQVGLRPAHHIAEDDRLGGTRKAQAAVLAADCRDIPRQPELVRDLHQVIARDPVALGDLGDGREAVLFHRQVHQQAQRKIGVDGQAQRRPFSR